MFNKTMMFTAVIVTLVAIGSVARAEKLYDLEDDLPVKKAEQASIYQLQFLEINKDLVEGTESTDPEENFRLIKEIREKHSSWFDSAYRQESVKLFTSLPKSLSGCGYKTYKVLARNFIASQGRSHQPGGLRRVDSIVYHYALEHAKLCRPLYANSFKEFLANVDQQVYRHVTELFKELPESDLVKFAKMDYATEVDMLTTGLVAININKKNTNRILEALERLIEEPADRKLLFAQPDEINGGYLASPKFKKDIFERYIESPCSKYVAKSKHVFAPARFDAAIEDDAQKDLLHPTDGTFRQAWVNHRLCQYLLRMPPMDLFERVVASRIPSA